MRSASRWPKYCSVIATEFPINSASTLKNPTLFGQIGANVRRYEYGIILLVSRREEFAEIMHLAKAGTADNTNLVCTVLELYAKHLKNQGRTRPLEIVTGSLENTNGDFGNLRYEELKRYVEGWRSSEQKTTT